MPKGVLPRQDSLSPSIQPAANAGPTASAAGEPTQPRKRGRKPGPLSRSAREVQRKLNHSIIEKARRTKINEALAALRQLVPSDPARRLNNGQLSKDVNSSDDELDDDEGEDEGDGSEYRASRRKPDATAAKTKKKEEKEFKLGILERTVTYLQDLTVRYDDLQKRHEQLMNRRPCHCSENPRWQILSSADTGSVGRKRSRSNAESAGSVDIICSSDERPSKRHEPLPPISSWMPLSPDLTGSPMNSRSPKHDAVTPPLGAHLPTPPSSTLFQPTVSPMTTFPPSSSRSIHIPSLSLGPMALSLGTSSTDKGRQLSASVSPSISATARGTGRTSTGVIPYERSGRAERVYGSPTSPHTPEDESAASLLLTMRLQQHSPSTHVGHKFNISPLVNGKTRTSPIGGTRSRSGSSASGRITSPPSPSSFFLPPPGMMCSGTAQKSGTSKKDSPESFSQRLPHNMRHIVVETPGSLLGLTGHRNSPGF